MAVISVKALGFIQVSIIVLSSFYELSHGEGRIENVSDATVLEPLRFKFGRKRPPPPKQQQPSPPRPVKSPPLSPPSPPPPVKSPPPPSWTPPPPVPSQPPPPPTSYFLMEYVLQWGPTTCIKSNGNCKPSFYNPQNANKFSLHGLWPANMKGYSLRCKSPGSSTVGHVWANDQTLKSDLQNVWPSLLLNSDEWLWTHEWNKHGYCTRSIISDVDYFKAAITINSMIEKGRSQNLVNYLNFAGIHASNSSYHSKTDIIKAIYPLVGNNHEVYVSCETIKKQMYLKEIYLCLDFSLKNFISCPRQQNPRGCGPSNKIVIPAF